MMYEKKTEPRITFENKFLCRVHTCKNGWQYKNSDEFYYYLYLNWMMDN